MDAVTGILQFAVLSPWSSFAACLDVDGGRFVSCATESSITATFAIMLVMSVFCFIASAVTNNDSWVDRLWSVIPVVYAWTFLVFQVQATGLLLWNSPSLIFTTLVTIWGVRLTYNFYRKGGYTKGGEDYRWLYVRSWPIFSQSPRILWFAFSLTVVSLFQSWLLWAITLPLSFLPSNVPATTPEVTFAAFFIFFLALETLADQQQWQFQNEKRGLLPQQPAVNYSIGFCIDGVFAYSRHMNVWSEQSLWITVFFAGAVTCGIAHPCVIGCATLVALTIGSTRLTEAISSAKYPSYAIYQETTPMLIPSLRSTEDHTTFLIEKGN